MPSGQTVTKHPTKDSMCTQESHHIPYMHNRQRYITLPRWKQPAEKVMCAGIETKLKEGT